MGENWRARDSGPEDHINIPILETTTLICLCICDNNVVGLQPFISSPLLGNCQENLSVQLLNVYILCMADCGTQKVPVSK